MDRDARSPSGPWTAALIGLRVVVLVLVIVNVPAFRSAEALRAHQIASAPGVPYRDFPVEYPIGGLGIVELAGSSTEDAARVILALIAFGADLGAFAAVRYGWGASAARRYLVIGTPLLIFIYRRSDLVAVALATLGLAVIERRRGEVGRSAFGGAALGAAALVKLWPCVLVPALLVERRRKAIWAFVAVLVAGVAGWSTLGGVDGIRQVVTFRGSTGWELESTVGAVVWAVTGEHRFEQGANRTGMVPGWAGLALWLILVAGLAAVWRRAKSATYEPAGAPALVAVALLLVTSPVLSPQYVAWLLPWGAVAANDARRWWRLAVVPSVLTGTTVASWYLGVTRGHPGWSQAELIVRNATLAAIPLTWFLAPVVERSRITARVPH